jgi:hypothetical protein
MDVRTIVGGGLALATVGAGVAGGYAAYKVNREKWGFTAAPNASFGLAIGYVLGGGGVLGLSRVATRIPTVNGIGAQFAATAAVLTGAALLGTLPGLLTASAANRDHPRD